MTDQDPHITVIVPARDAASTVDRCLDALESQSIARESYEIIVVDDGSSDTTAVQIQARQGVRLLTQRHAGAAMARNLGARHARGALLLFTDADCAPAADWVERMAAPLEGGEASGCKGVYTCQQQEVVARFVQAEYEDRYLRMSREQDIDFIDTYAAAYKREVFDSAGGFDPALEVGEDQDLSFRLAERGHRMVFVPDAKVVHWGHASSLSEYWRKKVKIGYWKVQVTRRHPPKLLRDSHTPQVLKLQLLLAGIGGLLLVGGLAWMPLWWAAGGAGILFLATCLPFVARAWRKDRVVALASPFLLLVRAVALGTGFALGLAVGWVPGYQHRGA